MNSDANDGLPSDLRPQVRQIMHAFSSVLYSFKFRAYNISRRKPWVLWFLLATFIVLSAVRTMFISFCAWPVLSDEVPIGGDFRERLRTYTWVLFCFRPQQDIEAYFKIVLLPYSDPKWGKVQKIETVQIPPYWAWSFPRPTSAFLLTIPYHLGLVLILK